MQILCDPASTHGPRIGGRVPIHFLIPRNDTQNWHLELAVMPDNSPLIRLEGMLTWIRLRPQNYCYTLGELDSVLHFLHEVWAKFAARETDYRSALALPSASALGTFSEIERIQFVGKGHRLEQEIVTYWAEVDAALGIVCGEDVVWDEHTSGGVIDDDANVDDGDVAL